MSKKSILISLAIVLGVQVGLWVLVGADGPLTTVPKMIAMDIEEARRHYETQDGPPPEISRPETLVLCPSLDEAIGSKGVGELQDLLAPLGKSVVHEIDAPDDWITDDITKPGFTELCAEVAWRTPIVAQVEVVYWNSGLAAAGSGHRAWFVLGFWIPSRANSAWVS